MTGGLTTRLVEEDDEFRALEPDWWELWRRSPTATPFTSPAWLLPWRQVFATGPLRTVAARDSSGRLVGLAPLYLEEGALGRRLLPLGIGISDLFDLLLHPDAGEAGAAIASALARDPSWEICDLENLPAGAAALALPTPEGCGSEVGEQDVRPVLALGASPALPATKRRKLAMTRRRLGRRGGTVEPVGASELDAFLSDLARLHGARWTARGEPGVLADPLVLRFHALAMPELDRAGLLEATRCLIEGRVVGAYYGFRHAGRAYAYLGGFDPGFAYESPGTALIGEAVEAAAAAGCSEFDFLRGAEPYKYDWGARDRPDLRRRIRREPAHD